MVFAIVIPNAMVVAMAVWVAVEHVLLHPGERWGGD